MIMTQTKSNIVLFVLVKVFLGHYLNHDAKKCKGRFNINCMETDEKISHCQP